MKQLTTQTLIDRLLKIQSKHGVLPIEVDPYSFGPIEAGRSVKIQKSDSERGDTVIIRGY